MNEMGAGSPKHSSPLQLSPAMKPIILDEQKGVTLSTIEAHSTSVSVFESSTSLLLTWQPPYDTRGFNVSSYLLEYWISHGLYEVQTISLFSPGGPARGTFALSYDGHLTDSLSVDISADNLKAALEALHGIRSVRVGSSQNYVWTVTFLAEYPSVNGKKLTIDEHSSRLTDSAAGTPVITIGIPAKGVLPTGYISVKLPAGNALDDSFCAYTFSDLTAGVEYYFRVSACNMLGCSPPRDSVPNKLAPLKQKPSAPTNIILSVHSDQSLSVTFSDPISNGGDAITKYKIEWDTNALFTSKNSSSLGAYSKIVSSQGCNPCNHVIYALVKGTHYFVRIYAYNAFGYSHFAGIPSPNSESPKTRASPPSHITVVPESRESISVSFPPTDDNGGGEVTKYKIEWEWMGNPTGKSTANLYASHTIQTITSNSDEYDISGSFRVSYDGFATKLIGAQCTSNDMKKALEELPSVGTVSVSRKEEMNGYIWLLTFLSNFGDEDWYGDMKSIGASVIVTDSPEDFVLDTSGIQGTLSGTNAAISIDVPVRRWRGHEQQTISTQCSSDGGKIQGTFQLSFKGVTANLGHDVSATIMKDELERNAYTGKVFVSRRLLSEIEQSYEWTIIFIESLGNVPLIVILSEHLSCFDGNSISTGRVVERISGIVPDIGNSPFYGEVEIDAKCTSKDLEQETMTYLIGGLPAGAEFYVRVAAWNGVGYTYGPSQHSTPAVISAVGQPDPPTAVSTSSLTNSSIFISWTEPLNQGGADIEMYKVEWDAHAGMNEIQTMSLSASSPLYGTFTISFKSFTTEPISLTADARVVEMAMESLQSISDVDVSRSNSENNYTWLITFIDNVGDQPLIEIDSSYIRGSSVSSTVIETTVGTDPLFDQGSVGMQTVPLGSTMISRSKEIQMISVSSSANDLSGYFRVHFMGQTSAKIYYDYDAAAMKNTLEGLSTIWGVDVVSKDCNQITSFPFSSDGRKWEITFRSHIGNLPSIVVDTGNGISGLIATGGTLEGSNPVVQVETLSHGSIEVNFSTPNTLKKESMYFARVTAFNGFKWSKPELSSFGIFPTSQIPRTPTDVFFRPVSNSEIGVSWSYHHKNGDDSITKFSVQWDTDTLFDHKMSLVPYVEGSSAYSFLIPALDASKSYLVRVIAYNNKGYSQVANATPMSSNLVRSLLLQENLGAADVSEKFTISDGVKETEGLSVQETSANVENTLNTLNLFGPVSVSREDHSHIYDSTGKNTMSFYMIYRITFMNLQATDAVDTLEIKGTLNTISGIVKASYQPPDDSRAVAPYAMPPSGPADVTLHVVSQTELGVSWGKPHHSGGRSIKKYLVEWDKTYKFDSSKVSNENPYNNIPDGPLANSYVVVDTSFQITGLDSRTTYFVRVSAFNLVGYSPAVESNPPFATTSHVTLYKPTLVTLAVSPFEIPNRLLVEWALPSIDINGFTTQPNTCGVSTSHTPNVATHYEIQWDTNPSMREQFLRRYQPSMIRGDSNPMTCCESAKCSIEIGTEVQTITLKSNSENSIAAGSFKVVYVGIQSASVKVVPSTGSNEVVVKAFMGSQTIKPGDYFRIGSSVHMISSLNYPLITLSTKYIGEHAGEEIVAYFNTPPPSCFNAALDNGALDLQQHISQNFDNSPFNEDISVSRSSLGPTTEYHVTFTGPAFSDQTEELFVVSNLDPWFDLSCDELRSGASSKISIDVTTDMDSTSLVPGAAYYVKIAAINSIGIGTFASTSPINEVPRAPSGLAQDCRVYAVPASATSLRVEWRGVSSTHGNEPLSYSVEFYANYALVATHVVTQINEKSLYSIVEEELVASDSYKVVIVPVNDQGSGGPSWFANVDESDGTLSGFYQDYQKRSSYAIPTCDLLSDDCLENGGYFIKARGTPKAPLFSAATYPTASSVPNRFSKNSIHIIIEELSTEMSRGDLVDKFRIEWSNDPTFIERKSHILIGNEFTIDGLGMGTIYHVRVFAHNSAGYGAPASSIPVKPMQVPDPPYSPIATTLSFDLHTSEEVGTSLEIIWGAPKVDSHGGHVDFVGPGGDAIKSYLVEWSKVSWEHYIHTTWDLIITDSSALHEKDLEGCFRLTLDTTANSGPSIMTEIFTSANIPVDATAAELTTIIQNMPNTGEVLVTSVVKYQWTIEFQGNVGNISELTMEDVSVFEKETVILGIATLSLTTVGSIPEGASYAFDECYESLSYTIKHLIPGQQYYVRVAAANNLGYGSHRTTAPLSLMPPIQKPGKPLSIFHDDSNPVLRVASSSSLLVQIGPPAFDGGAILTQFVIEWDSSANFDSLSDGSALGSVTIDALTPTQPCSNCVIAFDSESNTFTYSGNSNTVKQLIAQRKVAVYFSDDDIHYLFSVISATLTSLTVSSQHLRTTSLVTMKNQDGISIGTNLDIAGAQYEIVGLTQGVRYFVRVTSVNGEMGSSLSSTETFPSSEIPRGIPSPPAASSVSLTVLDKQSLKVEWKDPPVDESIVQAYVVECFTKSLTLSGNHGTFFGTQEVVQLDSSGLGLMGGTFAISFGDTNILLPGKVSVSNGRDYAVTSIDLAPFICRGCDVVIDGSHFTVDRLRTFSSTRIPLSRAYDGNNNPSTIAFTSSTSTPISYDGSSSALIAALENMPSVGKVHVDRFDGYETDEFIWRITFLSNMGALPILVVDTSQLLGKKPDDFSSTILQKGIVPENYQSVIIDDIAQMSATFNNLATGVNYYARLRYRSDRGGDSLPTNSVPISTLTGQIPGKPFSPPQVRSLTESTLLVTYEEVSEKNGADITEYIIEVSTSASYNEPSIITSIPVNHRVQRVMTSAHTTPWESTSTFTLSLNDFYGTFTSDSLKNTYVSVQHGSSQAVILDGGPLNAKITRGDFFRLGGNEYRVCLIADQPYDSNSIPLCKKDNAWLSAKFSTNVPNEGLDRAPVFLLDTSLGSIKQPTLGDTSINTINAIGLPNDVTGRLNRGDYLRVGHPHLGETFRVSIEEDRIFDDQNIPLASFEDASVSASLSFKSLVHAPYEIQSYTFQAKESSSSLTQSSVSSSGYRIMFESELTHTTKSSGSAGCIAWDGSADALQAELETFHGIDAVETTRTLVNHVPGISGAGITYHVTFTGRNVRGNVPSLQIVDVGANGCLNADDDLLGGKFLQHMEGEGIVAMVEESMPYLPFYKVQTTVDIPFDASPRDVKAAIEDLSHACKVDVSRDVYGHGFSWDVTFRGA